MNFKKVGLGFVLFGLVLGIGISSSASGSFEATLDSLNSQNFPFTFSNVRVTDNGIAVTDLTADNFKCSENGIVQTDFFQVTSPQTAGGVRLADIVFLIDASGSMGDAINGVKNNVNTFADALVASDVDYRLGLVQFGQYSDSGHPQLFNSGNLTDAAQFKEFVNTLSATGGYEPGFLALRMAAQGFNFRPGAQKVFLLISDEDSDDRDKEGTITLLQTNDIVVHTAVNCAFGYSSSDYCDGTSARAATGGQLFGVQGPYSDILDSIVTQTASTYVIRYKSSNPTFDGTERAMECAITRGADQATVFGSYIPGSAPIITLSAQTEILNQNTLPENSPDAIIRAAVTDEVEPFAKSNGVWLYYRTSGSNSDYLSTMMILNGQYYEATIPIVSSPGVDYYLTATDGEQASSLPSTDPGVYPFQIAVLPNVMPNIAHEPVISAIKNKPITITATITDTTEFLQKATLKYRRMGELLYKTIEMHNTSGDTFEAIIPADDVTDDIEYYLIAKDNFNVAAYKATADEPFVIGFEAEVLPQCSDGIDNDGDGKVDADDLGCVDGNDDSEWNEVITENTPPVLSFPDFGPYAGDGFFSHLSHFGDILTFKVIYSDADNDAPSDIFVGLEKEQHKLPMALDKDAGGVWADGDFTNGEMYVVQANDFAPGDHSFFYMASDGETSVKNIDSPEFGFNVMSKSQCSDRIDNDGDGKVDKDDMSCYNYNVYDPNIDSEADKSFSFVHMTDVHLGGTEYQSYPRFTDDLYEIEKMTPKPDFILIGGDNVEYDNITWLEDFNAIIEDFTARTQIEIYVVPGNHDRREGDLKGGSFLGLTKNDQLEQYIKYIKNPKEGDATILFKNLAGETLSGDGGYNKYNYYFNHKGIQFIGLDSGEDGDIDVKDIGKSYGFSDLGPEGSGLSDACMRELNNQLDKDTPKVVFMHHPIITGGLDDYDHSLDISECRKIGADGKCYLEDASLVDNWQSFKQFTQNYNVQMVLSGHNHADPVFDKNGQEINLLNWKPDGSWAYPLFIQTQSATKDSAVKHNFRVVKVENGKVIPQKSEEDVTKYEKVYSDLDSDKKSNLFLNLSAYDSDGREITENYSNGKATPFFATSSKKIILYDDTEQSTFKVSNGGSDTHFDLRLQKRETGAEPGHQTVPAFAFAIDNQESCSWYDLYCPSSLLTAVKGNGYTGLYLKNIRSRGNSSNNVVVDWNKTVADVSSFSIGGNNETSTVADITSFKIGSDDVGLEINGNNKTSYKYLRYSLVVDLNSPGELRVIDANGNITGVVDGEIVEDIPYSIYIPESETVYVFGNSAEEVASGLKTQVVGSYEATYDLALSLSDNNQEKGRFMADDILTNGTTIHQFSVDWQTLAQGGDGVTMQIDKEGDGVFEQTIVSDATLEASEITASNPVIPTNTGGGGGIYTATSPTDASVAINNGESVVENAKVNLTLSASGAAQMAISNSPDFADVGWEDFKTVKEWDLSAGVGEKIVYVKFRSANGGVSSVVSDSINRTEGKVQGAATVNILDGDIIQCKSSADPFAVYIVKTVGDKKYIRHIVSPEIFNHYGHLKWGNIVQVDSLDGYSLSGWVRVNTGINGTAGANDKVYEINGDQTKHWINMTAQQFLTHGGSEEAIYSINQGELDLYGVGADVTL